MKTDHTNESHEESDNVEDEQVGTEGTKCPQQCPGPEPGDEDNVASNKFGQLEDALVRWLSTASVSVTPRV